MEVGGWRQGSRVDSLLYEFTVEGGGARGVGCGAGCVLVCVWGGGAGVSGAAGPHTACTRRHSDNQPTNQPTCFPPMCC